MVIVGDRGRVRAARWVSSTANASPSPAHKVTWVASDDNRNVHNSDAGNVSGTSSIAGSSTKPTATTTRNAPSPAPARNASERGARAAITAAQTATSPITTIDR